MFKLYVKGMNIRSNGNPGEDSVNKLFVYVHS